jgi:hypothetical protein
MLLSIRPGLLALLIPAMAPAPALAVEGGLGAYLLGSRDSMAGFVPPPGSYVTLDVITLDGLVKNVSIGGLPVASADVHTTLVKLGFTMAFDAEVWGGQPALNLNLPFATADIDFTGPLGGGLGDSESGLGDIAISPLIGWHSDKLHWNVFATLFAPVGKYDAASVDLATRDIDALSIGKNVWSVQPGFAVTWIDPERGLELSAAASVLFSEYNSATDYQSAPQIVVEGAVMQHLPSGLALGLTGYAFGQTGDDSGSGAEAIKTVLGVDSLQSEVYGIGPLVTYRGKIFGRDASFKAEYTHEFGAKRRFESDVVWLSATLAF